MRASSIAFWAPKDGSSDDEYEDAWQVVPGLADEIDGDWVAVAVADGATESFLARQWANTLVSEFAINAREQLSRHWFAKTALGLATRWPGIVDSYVTRRLNAGKPLAWYERPGLAKGAFATLITLQMDFRRESRDNSNFADPLTLPIIGRWYAAALGDTCLFHVQDGHLESSFPIAASARFGATPSLICSAELDPQLLMDRVSIARGAIAEGDDFYICTDAMAAWFLASVEKGERPWELLRDLNQADFMSWLFQARLSGDIHNDDVTLIHIDVW